ncbi:hypothetical protein PAPYR_11602 [Paratrimastix pyriformis]|uniref:Uncharacterized protein n=1 Tax=Paratrimastix pyriformis TaxID=342808 RepID=A0ABQ8U767_9EUKA|nr:hypothetical protein PAPYR_11602 [Paratrimastix pyriformis]
MQYCGCSFVFDFFERLLVFTGASLQRCMREILIARAPMRRLFEVFDWFTTKTTRSGVAQSFTLSTKRFVLCELDTVILVRSFKAVPLLSPNSPFFLGNHAGPLFFGGLFCKMTERKLLRVGFEGPQSTAGPLEEVCSKFSPAPVRAHLGHSSAMSGRQSTVGSPSGHSTGNSRKGYIFEPRWNSDVPETRAPDPHGFARGGGEVPHLGHCASLALHLALHCISRSLRLSGITPLKENETLDDLPGGAFPWPGYIGHFRGTTRTRASLPIALAQPAGFPSGFELRDGLLKARGTCLLGLGRVVLVTDHSDTVERSLCKSAPGPRRSTTTQPPSWETRRHGTRAPSGTDSLALEAMSEGTGAHTYAPTGLTHWDRGTSKAGGQLHRLLPHCGLLYLVVNENQTVFWIKEKITPDAFSSGFGVFEGTWLSAILQAAVPEWSLNCNNPTTETLSKPSPAATRGQWCPLRTSKRNENEKRIWNGFENSRASQKRSPLPPNLNIRTSDSNLAHVAPKKIHAGGSDYQMWFVPNDQTFSWSQATLLALRFLFLELPPTAYCKILSGYLCDFSPLRFPMALLTIAAAAAARGIIETLLLPKPPGK